MRSLSVRNLPLVVLVAVGVNVGSAAAQGTTKTSTPPRFFAAVDVGAQVTTTSDESRVTYKLHGEDAVMTTSYSTVPMPAAGARLGVRVWRNLILGAGATFATGEGDADVDARLPHPFFFQRPRTSGGSVNDVTREETTVYAEIGWLASINRRFDVLVFAGPAFFGATQECAIKTVYKEQYPFDEATFETAETTDKRTDAVGFTAGADLQYRLTSGLRLGALVRYSRATATVTPVEGQPFDVLLGGLQTTLGLRILF